MNLKLIIAASALVFLACKQKNLWKASESPTINIANKYDIPKTIGSIPLPEGYTRTTEAENSFGQYLRKIELKENKTVYLYNGTEKGNQSAQYAVLNISVGKQDLQQCADAVMRLRAEYLFEQKRYGEIDFIDNENKHYKFKAPFTRANFDKYLPKVFGMCGSASLAMQLKTVQNFKDIKIGDVIIKGGFPGHAVQVMDIAKNESGQKIYLLAQSYMPAQDIHVLVNNNSESLSPWYQVNDNSIIYTPEYTFTKNQLKAW